MPAGWAMPMPTFDEMEAQVLVAFNWPQLVRALHRVLVAKERFAEGEEPEDLPGLNGRLVFGAACKVLEAIVSDEELRAAYDGTLEDGVENSDKLLQVVHRLMLVEGIFDRVSSWERRHTEENVLLAKTSLRDLWLEIAAIRAGDKPQLLAELPSPQGRPINAHRLAFHQLDTSKNRWRVAA